MIDFLFSILVKGVLLLFLVALISLFIRGIICAIRGGMSEKADDTQNVSITINFKDAKKDK